jgi:hypothetical protein
MRQFAAAFILLAAMSAAAAQSGGFAPGSVVTCPIGTTAIFDKTGNRVCTSLSQKPLYQGLDPPVPLKPKPKRFERSTRCPECK